MQRAVSVPLLSTAVNTLELQQVKYLFHRDLVAKLVEVDARHGLVLFGRTRDRSVPSLYMGNGNGRFRWRFRVNGALPAGRRTADSLGLLESLQRVAQPLVFDRQHFTKLRPGQHTLFGEEIQYPFLQVVTLLATDLSGHLKMRRRGVGRDQIEVHGSSRGRRTVLAR